MSIISGARTYAVFFLCLLPAMAFAAETKQGITSNYSLVEIDNLPIGQTISMKQVANLPLKVGSAFGSSVYLMVSVLKPDPPKEGYEQIPDVAWVVPESYGMTIPAFGKAELDVKINIPDDTALLGRKFHVKIDTSMVPLNARGMTFGFGALNNLFFSIAPQPNKEALDAVIEKPLDVDFFIDSQRSDITQAKPGTKRDLINIEGKPATLKNTSDHKQEYFLSPVAGSEVFMLHDVGAQVREDLDNIVIQKDKIVLNPGQTKPLNIQIKVPEDADMEKGPLYYAVSVQSGSEQSAQKYIQIYLWPKERRNTNIPDTTKDSQASVTKTVK